MAGCFGESKEDRHFEKELDDYLDSQNPEYCTCDPEEREDDEGFCTECELEIE